ncbi:hypothetical protein DFH08DRAFT_1039809 [Mycena albidolilacea]|uniref:Novel STAND NTPase 1 domain-containing protein n=1 Tax=Mycena albidolilacea TaxID=1033008 RepID=A0AAD6ZCU4_9AGAR|nr:hypothetical protein DFH08DRAFT_1039809 [Mycena albidolilacea]
MPPNRTSAQIQLKDITTCMAVTAETLGILASSAKTSFIEAISNTTQSLLKNIQTVKQNKDECIQLMEKTLQLLEAIIAIHINSETGGEFPPSVLNNIGNFTRTLHKIHTFVEAQQGGRKVFNFFHQSEMSTLLKGCKAGLQQGFESFQAKMQEDASKMQHEVLGMVEALSDASSSDKASSVSRFSSTYASSTSISMLPPEPKIFHGRETELTKILGLFSQGTARIAILGAGGMGKTSLARIVIHHTEIVVRYGQYRHFVACDSAKNKVELAALVGAHLGLKPGQDLTWAVVNHFSNNPPSLLILDNLETVWEPTELCPEIEEFLSLLTDVDHLALIITMRGARRPGKVRWTHPFLPPLEPLDQDAAQKIFMDITDGVHEPTEAKKVLALTGNMPLAIDLLANLVDTEGCSTVLFRWEQEKTSLISDGYDKISNLNLSIALSLSSPRLNTLPQAKDLLSLLSMLPDGLSNADLIQSKLPLDNILGCKATLIGTSLAYSDAGKRLKVLVPIREYMQKIQPPEIHLIRPLLKYFQELIEFHQEHYGTMICSSTIARISSNLANIQNVLHNGLQQGHPDLKNSIYCACYLNLFSRVIGQGILDLIDRIYYLFPIPQDYQLEACVKTEMLASWQSSTSYDSQKLISQVLELFEMFEDAGLKCKFYLCAGNYYFYHKNDSLTATKFYQSAISMAISAGNSTQHAQAWFQVAWMKWQLGDYSAAQSAAYESQQLAISTGNVYCEAQSLCITAACLLPLGKYSQSIYLCDRAINLLGLCDHPGRGPQAEIEAYNIQTQIFYETSLILDLSYQGHTALNFAQLQMSMHAPKEEVQKNVDAAKPLITRDHRLVMFCAFLQGDLNLREGDFVDADIVLCKTLQVSWGNAADIVTSCLEVPADFVRWNGFHGVSPWLTVFFAHSLKLREKLGIYKALQFLGDLFLAQDDEDTAVSLFTVALEGFTYMDIHRSRAECLLHLGDISKRHDDLLKAVELWEMARPLLERSSQAKQIKNIDERLAGVDEDVREQHRAALAHLAELNTPSGIMEEVDDDDLEVSDLDDKQAKLVAI